MGRGSRFMVTLAAFIIVIAGMKAATSLLVPFLMAAFIAVISAPPLFWLERKGLPTALAMLIVILSVVMAGLFLANVVGNSVSDFSNALPDYQERLQGKTQALITWLDDKGIDVPDRPLRQAFDPGAVMRLVNNALSALGGVLTNAFLILFTAVFMLLEASSLPHKLRIMAGDPTHSLAMWNAIINSVKRYMALKTWMSLVTGIIITVWLKMLGVDYPLLWGLLAFLLNFVPNIGSIIAAIPAVMLALIQLGLGAALFTASGYLAVNFVVGNVIEPRVMGRGVGLSTLVVFVSLVFWGWVLGPVGMLLSVPLTMTVKIALNNNQDTRWLAILLDSESAVVEESPLEPADHEAIAGGSTGAGNGKEV